MQEKLAVQKRPQAPGANWTPLAGEPSIMFQKPKPRVDTRAEGDGSNKPWHKPRASEGLNRNRKPGGFAGQKRGAGAGFAKPSGSSFKRPSRAEG